MRNKFTGLNSYELKKGLWKLTVTPYNGILIGAIILTLLNARVWKIVGRWH